MRVESLNQGGGCSGEVGEIRPMVICPKAFLAMSENVSSSEWDAVFLWTKVPSCHVFMFFIEIKKGRRF